MAMMKSTKLYKLILHYVPHKDVSVDVGSQIRQ